MLSHTIMTHNNGYDMILLVNDDDDVVSAWEATDEVMRNYTTDTDADLWETGVGSDGLDDDGCPTMFYAISDYGDEVGRDGEMTVERRAFWFR